MLQDSADSDPECTSLCHATIVKVSPGCYTLAHDTQPQPDTDFTLDVTLFADSNGRNREYEMWTAQ